MNTLNIWCTGDSLTLGQGVDIAFAYPSQLRRLLVKNSEMVYVEAIGGDKIADVVSDAPTLVDPFYSARATSVLLGWVGTNNLNAGDSVNDAMTEYEAYLTDKKADGWTVYAYTILPRDNAGVSATFEADRTTFNTWLVANYASFADGLVDVAADSRIGDAGDEADTTYYNADLVHMTAAGYQIISDTAYAALQSDGLAA